VIRNLKNGDIMALPRRRIVFLSLISAGATITIWWLIQRDDWAAADTTAPPPYPPVGADARPIVATSGPLAATTRHPAKPVVAADHRGEVVVLAQDVLHPDRRLAQWRSPDGGESWQEALPLESYPNKPEQFGDPWLETDRRGRFYYVGLSIVADSDTTRLVFRRSRDAGQTWSAPIEVTKLGADRPVLGVSPNGRHLVIAASTGERTAPPSTKPRRVPNSRQLAAEQAAAVRFFSGIFVSGDQGRHWERLSGPLGETHAVPFSVVIDDDGRIASSWVAEGGGSRSVVSISADRGKTWTDTELVASLQPDRNHPFNGERFPVLAVDGRKTLHVAYVGEKAKELFVRSADTWGDWHDAIRLSSDDAAEVRMPAAAACGPMVHVTWMERRGVRWQTYYRGSRDHGRLWSETLLISKPRAGSALVGGDGFDIRGDDDQSSVTDDGLGNVHAVWAVNGRRGVEHGRVWHAIIRW
jgi:hypothetical protein